MVPRLRSIASARKYRLLNLLRFSPRHAAIELLRSGRKLTVRASRRNRAHLQGERVRVAGAELRFRGLACRRAV